MPDAVTQSPKVNRPWKVIAEEASREQDSKKLSELVAELNRAMAEQGVGKPAGIQSEK